jgi:hypothetical protein
MIQVSDAALEPHVEEVRHIVFSSFHAMGYVRLALLCP